MASITSRISRRLNKSWFVRSVAAVMAVGVLITGSIVPTASSQGFDTTNAGHFDYCGNPFSGDHNRIWVYLYEHPNYEGKCSRITASTATLNLAYVGFLTSSMRVVVPFGSTYGVTLYDGEFYGLLDSTPPHHLDTWLFPISGVFAGASTAGFVRVHAFPNFNAIPIRLGNVTLLHDISDRVKSIGISSSDTGAAAVVPAYGPEAPPIGAWYWGHRQVGTNTFVFGSPGARIRPYNGPLIPLNPIDFCSIWRAGCGPNPDSSLPPDSGGSTNVSGAGSLSAGTRPEPVQAPAGTLWYSAFTPITESN